MAHRPRQGRGRSRGYKHADALKSTSRYYCVATASFMGKGLGGGDGLAPSFRLCVTSSAAALAAPAWERRSSASASARETDAEIVARCDSARLTEASWSSNARRAARRAPSRPPPEEEKEEELGGMIGVVRLSSNRRNRRDATGREKNGNDRSVHAWVEGRDEG